MPGAQEIIERLEGLVATLPTASQRVSDGLEMVKVLLRSDGLKDKQDWQLGNDPTILQTTSVIYLGVSTVYAALIQNINADAEHVT